MGKRTDAKRQVLREHGSLNSKPQNVTDPLFRQSEFFDPRDLVQVKYEMLRRVRSDGHSVTQATSAFGFSRPTFYLAQTAFRDGGLPGLVHKRPGPKSAHKLSETVVQFIDQQKSRDQSLRTADLVRLVRQRFGLLVHARSIERAMQRRQKRGR